MTLARIEKKTLAIPDLAARLGVTVEQPDVFARTYIVRHGGRVLHASSKTLRAMVCEAGGDPMED